MQIDVLTGSLKVVNTVFGNRYAMCGDSIKFTSDIPLYCVEPIILIVGEGSNQSVLRLSIQKEDFELKKEAVLTHTEQPNKTKE